MFKKFKDKLAEEMKQSPARLQASMQQLAQAVVSPALSNSSIQELSAPNDNFSLTEEGDETPKNSPAKHGFQNVDLMSPMLNSTGISRRSSISSVTSDTSSLFPIYESPANLYHLQSDMDLSASEIDENISPQLDKVTKDYIYSAYRKVQAKYHKYRGRYTDLAAHYRDLERENNKLKSVLVESQDKALRRITDLKEQCQLEQQAKAHLEEALRNDIEEKGHIINTLNTKIKLLQSSEPNLEGVKSNANDCRENVKDNLIDLNTESSNSEFSNENVLLTENVQLKDKLKKLENVVLKYKESLKRNKEKFTEILTEKNTLESDYEALKKSYNEKEKELNNVSMEIKNVTDQMNILKKREEESVISLAENKLSIHRELEDKEEQIKQLRLDLKHMSECKDNLSETIDKYKTEVEKLKLLHSTQTSDSEKREVIQDISRGKSEALKLMQQEMQEKLINLEEKMGLKYQEEVDRNTEHPKKLEKYTEDSIPEKTSKVDDSEILQDLKFKLDVKENELEKMQHKLEELQKLVEEYKNDKHNLSMQLVHYTELKNEQDAQKIIIEEKKKEAQTTIEKLQATVQSLDKELENMRSALVDRDEVCENYNIMLEKAKEEIKTLKEKVHDNTEINRLKKELESKIIELHGVHDELKSCNSCISDLRTKLQVVGSNTELLREEKSTLIKNISSYNNSIKKLKDDTRYVKNNVLEHSTQFSNEISDLRNVLITCLEQNGCIQNDEVQNLQTKLKDLKEFRQKHDELKTELEDAICLKSSLEVDLEKYKEQLKEMSIKLERQNELDLKNCKLIAEVDNLNFKLHDLRNLSVKVKSLQIELNSLKEELKSANATNQSLTSEVSDLKKELETANKNSNELEELKQKYMKTTETIASLKSENYNYNKLEEETKSLQSEIQFLKDNILKKDIEINTLSEELRAKEKCIETLKVDDENHLKLIEEHEKQITELTNTNKTSQKTIQTKLSQLKKLKAIKEQQDVTIQKLNDEINEIKTSNTGLLEQLKQLEEESDALKSENCQILTLKDNNSIIASELEQLRLIHSEINLENKNLKDKENEFLKHNQELYETNEKLTQNISHYEKHNQQLLNDSMQLNKEIELHKNRLSEQDQDIENLKSQITVLNTELQSKTEELKSQMEELALCKKEMKEMKEHLTTENERLLHEMSELKLALKDNKNTEERNKELSMAVELLEHKLTMLKSLEEENNKIKLELNSLHEEKIKSEKVHLQNNELISDNFSLKNQIKELDNLNSVNVNLQSYVQNLESKINSLEQVESKNNELKTELDALEATNRVNKERLTAELDELKLVVDEKVAELKLLDTKNTELLREIERLKSSAIGEDAETEVEISKSNIEYLKEEITKLEAEAKILKESNTALQKEIQNAHTNMNVDESLVRESDRLQEENKKLKAQFDEAVITFQAKESQMHIVNNELKNEADKLREESKTNEEEQSMRLKQLVKEFQAQLHDKEEELHAALEKRFDHQQNYVSDIMQQYKEQLKDLQVELTAKSEQIENLILENKNLMAQKAKDINQLMEKITLLEKEHTDELRETEKKWKSIVQQKTNNLEAKHEEEVNELTKEWQNERRPDMQTDLTTKELENTSRVAMAAVQSNTGSFHTLQQTLTAQRRELAELRKLIKLRHDTLEDSTEIEYLRNILFEYMMGRETMVLARVIAAVVKFDQEQTTKILKKEEDKMTLLGSLGLT